MISGRIDVHSHLLPGVDDGCKTVEESIACARQLVAAGYTHSFCTPHVWPSLPENNPQLIARRVAELQKQFVAAGLNLELKPGGELNMGPHLLNADLETQPTYGMGGKYLLIDLWCDELPDYFEPVVRQFQSLGRTVILAHPERMRAVQDSPGLADYFASLGILLQGNFACLSDAPNSDTCRTAVRYLKENRYFMLGMDLHAIRSLPQRLAGLRVAQEMLGDAQFDRLTKINPSKIWSESQN